MAISILVHSNGADYILLPDGSVTEVDSEIFSEFRDNAPTKNWHGLDGKWTDFDEDMEEAAHHYGEPLAKWVTEMYFEILHGAKFFTRVRFYKN